MPHTNSARLPFLKDFKQSLFWNLFDSVGTQGLLILYHILFRALYGTTLHGKVGCSLSIFYLGIIILNLGLDYSLTAFLEYFTQSKRYFRTFLTALILPQLLFLIICMYALYALFPLAQRVIPALSTFGNTVSPTLLVLMCCTFISESLKKTAKTFLQLTFYTPLTALSKLAACCFLLV